MESVGAFSCSELDSFAVSLDLGQSLFSGFSHSGANDDCLVYPAETNFHNVPAGYFSGFNQIPLNNNNVFTPANMFMGIGNPIVGGEETVCDHHAAADLITADAFAIAAAKEMLLKRKFDSFENANKRIRLSDHVGSISDGQSSCSYSSEEENGGSETKPSMAINSNGKPRAARGGATDPQSLYARRRRERINERLRILQNLVPNGTKVDISTMLEEAVHYVKFLQLQIKLLSSDDLWMYAPLAYNGIDVSLYQKIFSQLLRQ